MQISVPASALLLTFLAASPAHATTQWQTTPDANAISWSVEAGNGNVLNGHCSAFASDIAFDATDLVHSNVKVVINMASCRTVVADKDATLPNTEWFNESAFPKADFKATKFRALGDNHYAADGTLTLKGITKPLLLDFKLDIKDRKAHAVGSAVIKRMDFGVGSSTSGDYAGLKVNVKIDLKATKK